MLAHDQLPLTVIDSDSPFLKVWRNQLPVETCRVLIAAMRESQSSQGLVLRDGHDTFSPDIRNCQVHRMPPTLYSEMRSLLDAWGREILLTFGFPPCQVDGPDFFSYPTGSHFRLHKDRNDNPLDPVGVNRRRLSLVLYLNGREALPDIPSFDGGALTVYDPTSSGKAGRRIVVPEAGTLVAFRSECLHEVIEVREGTRFAVVCWLTDDSVTEEAPHASTTQ